MSNNKIQKFVKKLFKIENEFTHGNLRPMNKSERDHWNSPNEIVKRKQIMDEGVSVIPRS